MLDDAAEVLGSLIPAEREVQDDDDHWYMVRVLPYRSMQDRIDGVVMTFVDITKRKQMEDELVRANNQKDELLGMVSHEFRTPMTIISGNIDVLSQRINSLSVEERDQVLLDLRTQRDRLQRLIENMLLLARAEATPPVEIEPVLLQHLLPKIVDRERHLQGSDIRLSVPKDLPPVSCETGYIEQVVENVLTNAHKYGRDGSQTTIDVRQEEGAVVVIVRNEGEPLGEVDVDRFFEPFYQSASRRPTGGTGLGLAVCRRLMEIMGGNISATANPGGGLQVSVTVAVADDSLIDPGE